ncbi:hemophilus surface fibril [Haemophilus influenzae]|uniref:Hemophilus surface fibril n=1 Tax=Haemophilus influenzae TaxID=727 RepID=A0A2X1RLX2_HAEIF|nr:hemophilus surface fibril [Haemophilus influenzae]
MNKIFNVIWNVVTQTWVVVSELTRTHTKCASRNRSNSRIGNAVFCNGSGE